jgi:integrase/recombinase XerC
MYLFGSPYRFINLFRNSEFGGNTANSEPQPQTKSRGGLKLNDVPDYVALLDAIRKAYRDVENGKYRLKDLTLVATLVFTGCRLGEALNITKDDITIEKDGVVVKIKQLKKGREFYRLVPVPSTLYRDIVRRYLTRVEGKLFEITDRQARNIVYKFSLRYLRRKIRPHAIRHSYATHIIKTTRDLEVVRRLLGHADYKHVKEYLNYTQEDLKELLEKAFSV